MESKAHNRFNRFTRWTIFFTIFVVFAGSMVKVTGSGMGCPDWPKCFGYYIPPFSEDKITWKNDHDYELNQMIIKDGELLKAIANFSSNSEFNNDNWEIYDEHDYHEYHPMHTLIESINRWTSVFLGFAVLLMVIYAFKAKPNKAFNIIFSLIVFFLIGFEAWLGKLVVEGVLEPTSISFHMLAAFGIIIALAVAYSKNTTTPNNPHPPLYKKIQIAAFLYLLFQLVLGVFLRQTFDEFVDVNRVTWVDEAGLVFYIHRSSSLVYVMLTIITWRILKQGPKDTFEWKNFKWVLILTLGEILSGAIMGYLDIPKAAQPVHVIISSILLLVQANLFFSLFWKKNK